MPSISSQPSYQASTTKLFEIMMPRYINLPTIRNWLMNRTPPPSQNSQNLKSFSHTSSYHPPPPATATPRSNPLPTSIQDNADLLLCHTVFDGVAIGTLTCQNNPHPFTQLRDNILSTSTLSHRPLARNFAVDLRASHLEILEFSWMQDSSLIISCRRIHHPALSHNNLVLSADVQFFDAIPPNAAVGVPLLYMALQETSLSCPSSRNNSPSTFFDDLSNCASITETPEFPMGLTTHSITAWQQYTNRFFSCSQSGKFLVHFYHRKRDHRTPLVLTSSHPILYHFSIGQKCENLNIHNLYARNLPACHPHFTPHTKLSRTSTLTNNNSSSLSHPFPSNNNSDGTKFIETQICSGNDYLPSCLSSNGLDKIETTVPGPSGISTDNLESIKTSSSSPSQTSAAFEGYHQLANIVDAYGEPLTDPGISDVIGYPNTLTNISSVSSLLGHNTGDYLIKSDTKKDPIERVKPEVTSVLPALSDQKIHVMDNVYHAWAPENEKSVTKTPEKPKTQPKVTLSTNDRELQLYMTVDASKIPSCKKCGHSFPKRGNLARHIQTVHLNRRPFQCSHCPMRFGYKNHLKRHQTVHQRGNDRKCKLCPRVFKGNLQLTRHIKQQHPANR